MLCRLLNSSEGWNGQGCDLPGGNQSNRHRILYIYNIYTLNLDKISKVWDEMRMRFRDDEKGN
jgi:hypothetical protein